MSGSAEIIVGDCVEEMAKMPADSVDSIVTDPPYGLEFMGKEWDRLEPNRSRYKGKERKMFGKGMPLTGSGNPCERLAAPSFGSQSRNPRCENCGKFKWDHVGRKCECGKPTFRHKHMGNEQQAWHETWAREAFRVLKPGGHLLAFGGTRTYHRMVCAIEDAGFEIRDSVHWVYGSGFPKSLDVSKAIDKMRDDSEPRWHVADWLKVHCVAFGFDRVAAHFGYNESMIRVHWCSRSQTSTPTWQQWLELKTLLGFSDEMDAEVWRLNGRKGKPGEAWHEREVVGKGRAAIGIPGNSPPEQQKQVNITAPATEAAQQWQGWGTALKPAHEPICVARKPLSEKNVAQNVLRHSTGALNIDGCRVSSEPIHTTRNTALGRMNDDGWQPKPGVFKNHSAGRWPPNLLLSHHPDCVNTGEVRRVKGSDRPNSANKANKTEDGFVGKQRHNMHSEVSHADPDGTEPQEVWECVEGCPIRLLDEMSGQSRSRASKYNWESSSNDNPTRIAHNIKSGVHFDDKGGASRFFPRFSEAGEAPFRYQTKASRRERNAGLEGMPEKVNDHWDNPSRMVGSSATKNRQQGGGENSGVRPAANNHPTVKPIALMRWLVRLVTPPGGTVLDPFMGSGSTGCAAVQEGFDFIGIEMDESYAEIARRRIAHWSLPANERESPKVYPSDSSAGGEQDSDWSGTLF